VRRDRRSRANRSSGPIWAPNAASLGERRRTPGIAPFRKAILCNFPQGLPESARH